MGKEAGRREKTFHNHPVSSAIDYFIVNLRDSSEVNDKESSGHLEHKLKIKVGGNEEAIKNRAVSEPIDIEWMFETFKSRHYEPAGRPISRITKQLNTSDTVIGEGDRNRGNNAGGCLGLDRGGRSELKNLGRVLTNTGAFDYFRGLT